MRKLSQVFHQMIFLALMLTHSVYADSEDPYTLTLVPEDFKTLVRAASTERQSCLAVRNKIQCDSPDRILRLTPEQFTFPNQKTVVDLEVSESFLCAIDVRGILGVEARL